jgi:tetratricopeptide (TPR) repeat protein
MTLNAILSAAPVRARPGSLGAIIAMAFLNAGLCAAQDAATNTPATNAPVTMADTIKSLLTESSKDLAEGDYETAIRDASTAIQLDPHNASAYELRGSVYIEEKLWDRAERDYLSASKISGDVVYKYKLAEIKFLEKSYEDARSRFAALESDEHLGDLSTYKAFLCDLLGFHDPAAMRDLAEMDAGTHAKAYYYSHAAWGLYHGNRAEASKYFSAADQLYGQSSGTLYVASLIESRRFLLTTVSFAAKDGTPYPNASVFLENDGLRVSTAKGWITLPLDQLPDDLSGFPEDMREQIDRKKAIAPDGPVPVSLLTFTTRSGKVYDHVHWVVDDKGFSVLTHNGWIAVPPADLPEDQSSFPDELQHALAQKRASPLGSADRTEVVSFTSTRGKAYHQAKVFLTDDGLSVLTPQGWVTVPFRELPDDLSAFPSGWQSNIKARRTSQSTSPGMPVVSFTTKLGKRYDLVRASLGRSGVRLVTSQGWVEVPFKDLPSNLTVFPAEWRETIADRQAEQQKSRAASP